VKLVGFDCRLAGKARNAGIARHIESLGECMTQEKLPFGFAFLVNDPMDLSRMPFLNQGELLRTRAKHYSFSEQIHLPFELARARLALMHFTNFNRPLLCPVPCVVALHDLTLLNHPARKRTSFLSRWGYRFVVTYSCKKSAAVIVGSHYVARQAKSVLGLRQEKIHIIPNGVSSCFHPIDDPIRIQDVCHCHGLQPGFLLYVGQWRKHKNLARLMEAYALLIRWMEDKSPPLVLVGGDRDDPSYVYVRDILKGLDLTRHVYMLGFVPDEELVALYNAAALCVYPSLSEGQGIPPLEAMACGTPVVASNATAIPETVGNAGLLVDPTSPTDIAEAMKTILTQPHVARRLQEEGPKRASLFRWEDAAKKTLSLYKELLTLQEDRKEKL